MPRKTILCFSRSYLSTLLPRLMTLSDDLAPLHIVQNDAEQRRIEAAGQKVILNLRQLSTGALRDPGTPDWREPEDMRQVTNFPWSPMYADRYLPLFSQTKRLKLAGAMQAALDQLFHQYDIAGVLSEPVALFPTHYLLYLCRKHGVIPLFWANTYFPGHMYFVSDTHLAIPRRRIPAKIQETDVTAETIRGYFRQIAEDKVGPVYHHKFSKRPQSSLIYFSQRRGEDALILSPGLPSRFLQMLRWARAELHWCLFPLIGDYMSSAAASEHRFYFSNMNARQSRYDRPPTQYSRGNIFFPLQYEPEASLLYAAPWVRNQMALVESMLQALPAHHLLWVKEHPNQFGPLARADWQRLRRKYQNLRIVYGRENGRYLIQRCGLAVTITSTAGMDALVFGRRCLVLGNVFFQDYPGAIRVKSTQALAEALNNRNFYVDETSQGNIEALTRASLAQAAYCYPGDPQPSSDLYEPSNLARLVEAIHAELHEE